MGIIKLKSQLNFDDRKPIIGKYQPKKERIHPVMGILNGNLNHQQANIKLLSDAITQGFNPKWYCVLHFNDGGNSKKQQFRRRQFDSVEKDLFVVHNALYTELYSDKWAKKRTRAKSLWGIEYGDNPDKPHINLIIESLPYPYDDYRSFYVLLDRFLPTKCKCLSGYKDISEIQPIFDIDGNLSYITKESDFRNATLVHRLNDYQNAQLPI